MPTHVRSSRFPILMAAALLLVAVFVPLPSAKADVTFVVDNVTDDAALSACTLAPGDCSLRGAIAAANTTPGADTIEFLIPAVQCPLGVCTIALTNGPLGIDEAISIDATSQPKNSGPSATVCATETTPSYMRVEIVTAPSIGTASAFHINSTGASEIRGFAIGTDNGLGFDAAVATYAGSGHQIACNHLGLNAAGSARLGSVDLNVGVLIEDAASGVIVGTNGDGVDDLAERNVIALDGAPVYINGNSDNTIAGNYMGFLADGVSPQYTRRTLIRQGSSNNTIGTNGDGISDELERNYFGSNRGVILQGWMVGNFDNVVTGNTFGAGIDGSVTPITSAIEITDLETANTGYEVSGNTIFTADTGVGLAISGDPRTSTVRVDGNSFGVVGGSFPQNGQAILLEGAGASVISNNLITGSHNQGLLVRDDASLAAGSTGNCLIGNISGLVNDATLPVTFEQNWWGTVNGPSGNGSGTGDTVSTNVDFNPWLINPPDICNTAPVIEHATFTINAGAAIGTLVGVATVDDDGADLQFAITVGDPGGVFGVDPDTGEIVKLGTPDYPATTSYVLTLEVTDAGMLSDTSLITVELTNVAPVVTDNAFTLAEDAAAGAVVGTVVATDGDNDELGFSFSAGNTGGAFAIDSEGVITVAAPLDFEVTPEYALTVNASDGFESDTADVAITVTDVYETPTTPTFDDVPVDHTFYADIEWLSAEGITKGCNPPANDLFCPDASVTRGQMAAFLHRAMATSLVAGPTPDFTDIDDSVFRTDIEWLGAVGVTKGCNPPTNDQFCPEAVVTRQQMAAFLVRSLGYTAGAGSDAFTDDDGSLFEADIERLAEAGVTRGCNPPANDLFCPTSPVTRAQMAAFLNRALGG